MRILLSVILLVGIAGSAQAQRPGFGSSRGRGGDSISGSYYFSSILEAAIEEQDSTLATKTDEIALSIPIPCFGSLFMSISLQAGHTAFSEGVLLQDTTKSIPEELWSLSAGVNVMKRFSEGRTAGLSLSLGSAGDVLFDSDSPARLGVTAFLRLPVRDNRDSWRFSLKYSPFSDTRTIMPGISYSWHPSNKLGIGIGIPLSVSWQPGSALSFRATWRPVTNISAEASYRITDGFRILGSFNTNVNSWYLSERSDSDESFQIHDKRVSIGSEIRLTSGIIADINTGYVFDRQLGETEDRFGVIDDPINAEASMYLRAGIRFGH